MAHQAKALIHRSCSVIPHRSSFSRSEGGSHALGRVLRVYNKQPQPKSHMWRDRVGRGGGGGGISYIILMVEGEEAEVVKNKNQLHKSGPRRTSQQV